MIWGLSLEPGCVYNKTASVQTYLSLATLDCRGKVFPGTDPVKVSHVVLKTGSCEQLVCSLVQGLVLQQQLNLQLMPNEEVAFSNQGNCCVYITGYSVDGDDYRGEDEGLSIYPTDDSLSDTAAYEKNTGWLAEEGVQETESQTGDEATAEGSNGVTGRVPCSREETPETIDEQTPGLEPADVVCIAIKDEPEDRDSVPPRQGTPPGSLADPEAAQNQGALQGEMCGAETPGSTDGSQPDLSRISSSETIGMGTSETSDSLEPGEISDSCETRGNGESTAEPRSSTVPTHDSPGVKAVGSLPQPTEGQNSQMWVYYNQPLTLAAKAASQNSKIVISQVHNVPLRIVKKQTKESSKPRAILPERKGLVQVKDLSLGRSSRLVTGKAGQRSAQCSSRFQCRFCTKSLNCRRSLQNHEMIHTGVRPYQCRYCQKSFIQKSQWKVHERIHQGIKPYSCRHCGKTFSRRYNERMHTRSCLGLYRRDQSEGRNEQLPVVK